MKLIKYLYIDWIKLCTICCHFYINNTGMIILVLLTTNYYVY